MKAERGSSPFAGGRLYRMLALLWTVAILVACLWPGKRVPRVDIPFVDKWTHFVLFGVFAALWLLALQRKSFRTLLGIFFLSVIYGCVVEGLQAAFPSLGRSGDIIDALADAVGGALGTGLYWLWSRRTLPRV